jgi:hypothetical protein
VIPDVKPSAILSPSSSSGNGRSRLHAKSSLLTEPTALVEMWGTTSRTRKDKVKGAAVASRIR